MAKKLKISPSYGRGIPVSYDPYMFYRYRMEKFSKQAGGIEGLIYQLVPWSVIRSFAIAIDPFSRFKMAPGKFAPVERVRLRSMDSILNVRAINKWKSSTAFSSIVNYNNVNGLVGPIRYLPTNTETSTQVVKKQQPLVSTSRDTVQSMREPGTEMGEFEKIKYSIYSSPRQARTYYKVDIYDPISAGHLYTQHDGNTQNLTVSLSPTSATIRRVLAENVAAQEKYYLLECMQENALSMYKGVNPMHRTDSLFRNIAELHDLPRTIASLREGLSKLAEFERNFFQDIQKLRGTLNNVYSLASGIPKQYLSYHFGWKQLYKDALSLLTSPAKISKQIDMLIRRSGKKATYRSTRTFSSGSVALNGFDYEVLENETMKALDNHISRVITLDMVICSTFTFPTLNAPDFQKEFFLEKLGVYPRATDIYNLIPWSWLVDWATGLGNYIEILDEVNRDRSLINWGCLTGRSAVELRTTYASEVTSTLVDYNIRQSPNWVYETSRHTHTSTLAIDLQLRKELGSLFDSGIDPGMRTLSQYQESILGALLFQRSKSTR
jgi:hypothetical protein